MAVRDVEKGRSHKARGGRRVRGKSGRGGAREPFLAAKSGSGGGMCSRVVLLILLCSLVNAALIGVIVRNRRQAVLNAEKAAKFDRHQEKKIMLQFCHKLQHETDGMNDDDLLNTVMVDLAKIYRKSINHIQSLPRENCVKLADLYVYTGTRHFLVAEGALDVSFEVDEDHVRNTAIVELKKKIPQLPMQTLQDMSVEDLDKVALGAMGFLPVTMCPPPPGSSPLSFLPILA